MENKLYKLMIDKNFKTFNSSWITKKTINTTENFYKLIYEEIEGLNNEKN